ncbi:hypothetical protein GCM10010300_77700 [Streptomyces olivaceoviridis]|nr:hypothetical protein GCM10010300_77700 [Streptomyces olivaceoviridis]
MVADVPQGNADAQVQSNVFKKGPARLRGRGERGTAEQQGVAGGELVQDPVDQVGAGVGGDGNPDTRLRVGCSL